MKRLKGWQIVLLVIFWPIGIIYWAIAKNKSLKCEQPKTYQNPAIIVNNGSPDLTQNNYKVAPEQLINQKSLTLHIPDEISGCTIAYKYEDVDIAGVEFTMPDLNSIRLTDSVLFVPEPDNPYDRNAIKVLCNGKQLGHIHKGKLQNMIKDWLDRKDPIFTGVTKIDKDNKTIKFFIAFYRDPLYGKERWENISTLLTKTSKKDYSDTSRQENFELVSEDDILQLEYDSYEEDYVVSDSYGNELGELSKSISSKLRDKESNYELIPVVQQITENDSGKYGAKITIYLKPKT